LEIGENSIRSRVLGTVLSRSAAPHDVASRRAALRALTATTPWARTPRQPSTRRSVRRGATRVEPPSRPSPCAPCSHARRVGHPTPSPPYARSAAPGWQLAAVRRRPSRRTPAMPRFYFLTLALVCKEALNRLELGYKAGRSSPRASTEPPPSAIGTVPVNATSGCLSSQTRATPHSTRTPVAPALACWPAQAVGSPEPVSLRPPPGSHRRAMLPA
jgi:hypothetical protein